MNPEIKQTLELLFNVAVVLSFLFFIVAYYVQKSIIRDKNKKLKRKSSVINGLHEVYFADWRLIRRLNKTISENKFIMRISDDISAEMFKDNERLQKEVDTLKAKLYHKKQPK